MRHKYQLLERLRPEEFEALKADIAQRGVLVPVEVDDRGRILDGHHRVEIAEELGVRYRTIKRRFSGEREKLEHLLKINLLRRHLGPVAWAEAFRRLCEVRGIKLKQGVRNDWNGTRATVGREATELGVSRRTAYRRLRLADDLRSHPDLRRKVDNGDIDANRALRLVRSRQRERRVLRARSNLRIPSECRIERRDFRRLDLSPSSVDLLFCDPPFGREHLARWSDLAEFANRVLKPGHLLVAYCPQWCLPDPLGRLAKHLTYVWLGGIVFRGYRRPRFHGSKIEVGMRPLLFFSKGEYRPRGWVTDTYAQGGGPEKELHVWQQGVAEAR